MKKYKSSYILYNTFFVIALAFISCTNKIEKNTFVISEKAFDLKKEVTEIKIDDDFIMEKTTWEFHHYEPKHGKYLGIWPDNYYLHDFNLFKSLKNIFGFSKYYHANAHGEAIFNTALKAGFEKNNIWVGFNSSNYKEKVNTYGNVSAYYFDEPNYHDINVSLFRAMNDYIKINTKADFNIGDMKPVSCLDGYVNIADNIMCTTYEDGIWIGFCIYLWPGYNDQRPLWRSFKERYPNKNNFNWVSAS